MGDDMVSMIHEAMGVLNMQTNIGVDGEQHDNESFNGANEETMKFFKLLEDAEYKLYHGCTEFVSLSFIVHLLHGKVLFGWTDKSFDFILNLLKRAFPQGMKLLDSYYEAKKLTDDLGFTNETLDACPNNCMLFRGEDKIHSTCQICGASRYKEGGKQIAAKQMRYFPLKPRLQKLFISSKIAYLMKWHANERKDDGAFRHLADSRAWKHFDENNASFTTDSHNVRLGLATDGFNPFRTMSISHSTWPVILIPCNLPSWLCMKQPFLILSILIDGPKEPGNKIDVYLQSLIEELKELWATGVFTFDASCNKMFQLHAALLWTISDFPAYAMLSGWSTKGEKACPRCGMDTRSCWLYRGRKFCYMSHRRFLPMNSRLRKDKVSFNGKTEWAEKPPLLSGANIDQQLECLLTEYKKEDLKKRMSKGFENANRTKKHNWKKKEYFL